LVGWRTTTRSSQHVPLLHVPLLHVPLLHVGSNEFAFQVAEEWNN
jgi:hypothetical protein